MNTVRKGCKGRMCAVPKLFSLYSQVTLDGLVELEGLRAGGRNINNISIQMTQY